LSTPTPAGARAARFRLPVEPPVRDLLIASLAAIAAACQLFAWALARMPTFFLVFGLLLMGVAAGFALAALVRHVRLRWVAYVDADALTVVNGSRRTVLPWHQVSAVGYGDSRLGIRGTPGQRSCTLWVDRTREAHEGAQDLLQVMEARLVARQ
jgi:hypothetical protein